MKVAILSFEYPPETGYGGIGTYSRNLAIGLKELGIDVHVIAGANSIKNETCVDEDGIEVTRCRIGLPYNCAFKLIRRFAPWCSGRLENALTMYKTLKKLNNKYHFDVVEMPECGAEGMLVNQLVDIRTVVKFHTPLSYVGYYDNIITKDLKVASLFENMGIKNADICTSPSKFLADEVKKDLNLVKSVHVVPNGLYMDEIDRQCGEEFDIKKFDSIPMDSQIILYTGRFEFRKGVAIFEEVIPMVIREYPDALFMFTGKSFGYNKNNLLKKLKDCRMVEKAIFLGQVPYNDLLNILTQIDVFVAPSIYENFPYSCLEAMASRCAIVSTTVGGIPEMIENGKSGILVEPNNPEMFSDGILSFLDSPKKRSIFGKNARKRVEENFDYLTIAKKTLNIYSL